MTHGQRPAAGHEVAGACSGRAIALPASTCPGRRAPRFKSQPQAGPAGTRSALDAWEYRPVPAPAADLNRLLLRQRGIPPH